MKLASMSSVPLLATSNSLATSIENIVTLETSTGPLEGTLLTASSNETKIVALIIAGSGPTDRDGNGPTMTNNCLKMLAVALSKMGFSSLRYDKRGVGKSKSASIEEGELRFEDYISDANSWIEYLSSVSGFDKIVVIGHSEGSLIGMISSQQKTVDKFVSIAGAGEPADQTIRDQLKSQPPGVFEQSVIILDRLLRGETFENVPAPLNSLFRPSVQPYMISWFKYDPQKEISKLTDKPVLIIQGSTDIQVSLNDAERLARANRKAEKVIIKQMNHVFKAASLDRESNLQTYNQPDLPIRPELAQVVSDFMLN